MTKIEFPNRFDRTCIEVVVDSSSAGEPPAVDWAMDETGWPIDEEGNQIEGYIDGQLNFAKGGGKGNGKGECWNSWENGAQGGGMH